MRAPAFPLDLAQTSDEPIYVQIGRAIADDIRRGRLRAGDALPGSRELALSLGVHRNTVLAAIRELVSEGYLITHPARGTFVAAEVPEPSPKRVPRRRAGLTAPAFSLPASVVGHIVDAPPGTLSLAGGIPDVRLVPRVALARAYRTALARHGLTTLSYGDPRGEESLRAAVARFVAQTRSLPCSPDEVLVTRGSQMALFLAAKTVLREGDAVAVEAVGYRPAWDALRTASAKLVPIPVDAGGIEIEALEAALVHGRVRAVYLTPHHQYPTTVALAPARRRRLLELAAKHDMVILEDDYDHEFHYDGRPLSPLASLDERGSVLYFGTLSKVVAPGLRMGFLVAPASLVSRLADLRRIIDRQGDATLERAVAELLDDGTIARHVRRARRVYQKRRDAFVDDLRARFGEKLRFPVPPGGTALFARVDPAIDVPSWTNRAAAAGLTLYPGARFAFDGRELGALRLGFSQLDDVTRSRVLDVLSATMPRAKEGRKVRLLHWIRRAQRRRDIRRAKDANAPAAIPTIHAAVRALPGAIAQPPSPWLLTGAEASPARGERGPSGLIAGSVSSNPASAPKWDHSPRQPPASPEAAPHALVGSPTIASEKTASASTMTPPRSSSRTVLPSEHANVASPARDKHVYGTAAPIVHAPTRCSQR